MLRPVEIELRASWDAMVRLAPNYDRDARAGTMSDNSIGEITNVIRAVHGAADKIANHVQTHVQGRKSKTTSFPITNDESAFPALLERNLPKLSVDHPELAQVLKMVQPFNPGWTAYSYLPALYRTHAHHDFELHKRAEGVNRSLFGFINIGMNGISLGGPLPWKGIVVDTWEAKDNDGNILAITEEVIDWFWLDPEVSVIGTLLSLHNLTVEIYVRVASALGNPLDTDHAESFRLYATSAPYPE